MPRFRLFLALGAAALVMTTSSCNSDDAKADGTTGKATPGAAAASKSSSKSECATDKIPLPDGATMKNEIESASGCLTYTIQMTVTDPKGAYENTMAKAKAAGYEIEDAGRDPFDWGFEARHNDASPWSVITYSFGDDHSLQILAELRH